MPISNIVRSAVAGMLSHKLNLDTIANNLANVNTTGFKAGRVHFQDVLYENYTYSTNAEEVRVGAGVRPSAISPTYTQGALEQTDIPTDVAIYGEGFFQVRQNDGTFAYTRNGNFRLDIVDGQRVLVNTDGLPVMGPNAGPVVIGPEASAQSLTISSTGEVLSSRFDELVGHDVINTVGQVALAKFVNPEGLEQIGQTLVRESATSGAVELGTPGATAGFGQLVGGALEGSNVNTADEMTNMVTAQRAYSLSVQALRTLDEMIGLANNIRSR